MVWVHIDCHQGWPHCHKLTTLTTSHRKVHVDLKPRRHFVDAPQFTLKWRSCRYFGNLKCFEKAVSFVSSRDRDQSVMYGATVDTVRMARINVVLYCLGIQGSSVGVVTRTRA